MALFGLSEGQFRFATFVAIFLIMTLLETALPRRERRHQRLARWPTNIGVLIATFVAVSMITFVVPITATLTAIWAQSSGWGLFNVVGWPVWLEALIAFVVLDFVIWAQHWVMHHVPVLWRVHRVHHTDQDLDASTAVRFHPVEIILSIALKSAAVLALGADPIVVVVFEAAVNGAALFNHANLKLSGATDRVVRLFIVTPDMHRVHHSSTLAETNSNYGFLLSLWDRLFRVYTDQPAKGHDGMTIGLEDYQAEGPTRLGWSLGLPFRKR
ncbi:sterol desaturase family protein [Cucumibacter marinus]|uniref:sterol desaturase family protein n=1 Tax=Cucumibacter marinus TaxID=1121252 RepID=UPI000427A292|nr:sterol desaturase family protein [Cucumibacter marinus]